MAKDSNISSVRRKRYTYCSEEHRGRKESLFSVSMCCNKEGHYSNYAYTVSLIIDQHHSLQEHGFRVTYLGSLQTDSSIHSKIAQADYEILLSTPESFYDEFGEPKSVFKTLCLQKKIGLIAIDEAHLNRS